MKKTLLIFFSIVLVLAADDPSIEKKSIFKTHEAVMRPQFQNDSELGKKVEALLLDLTDSFMKNLADDDPLLFRIYAERVSTHVQAVTPWESVVDRDIYRRGAAKDLFTKLISNEAPYYGSRPAAMDWVSYSSAPWANKFLANAISAYQSRDSNWDWEEFDAEHLAYLIAKNGNESHRKLLEQMEAEGVHIEGAKPYFDYRLSHPEDKARSLQVPDRSSNTSSAMKLPIIKSGETSNQGVLRQPQYWILLMAAAAAAAGVILWLLKRRSR